MMAFMMWPRGLVGISGDNYVSPLLCAGTIVEASIFIEVFFTK